MAKELDKKMRKLKSNIITIDTETTGLNPYTGDRIFCWAYFTDKGEWGYCRKNTKNMEWLKQLLNNPKNIIIFQNAKFDLKMLWFEGIDVFNLKCRVDDVLIMSKVLRSTSPRHNLRTLSRYYLNYDTSDKDEIEEWVKQNKRKYLKEYGRIPNFSDAPNKIVKRRILWDVETTMLLYKRLKPEVMDICSGLYETERQLMFVCLDMENTGVFIDISKAKELMKQAEKDLKIIGKELNDLICPLTIVKKVKKIPTEVVVNKFNPGSTVCDLPAAFIKMGISLKYRTKPKKGKKGSLKKVGGGNWCFDEYAMIRYVSKPLSQVIRKSGENGWIASKFYSEIHRVLKKYKLHKKELLPPLVLKYRQIQKMISTYYSHLVNDCIDCYTGPDGREYGTLHCNFNQSEAMTGRFSSSKINLQNLPRLLGPRQCFIPRKGRKNFHADYDQVEMKFFVHFAKDKKMAKAIKDDIHLFVAAEVYGIPKEKIIAEQRKRAKSVNFGIIYGQGPAGTAETLTRKGLPTTENESRQFTVRYHKRFPLVKQTTRELKEELLYFGYVTNPFGRRYHIPSRFGYKSLNYMCQGTSADLMKLGMVKIWNWLQENGLKSKIIMTVHDEIVIEVPQVEEKILIPKIIELMEDHNSFFVPMTVSVDVVSKRWSKKKKLNAKKS